MGCSISCVPFEKFSSFLEWLFKEQASINSVVHFFDHVLFTGRQGSSECSVLMGKFQALARDFRVPLAKEKLSISTFGVFC